MLPLISIIIPVYNVELYLDKCILSVISQTYSNIEIILIDDGSTDASRKKCDNYVSKDSRITVFHKSNGGLSDARNYGVKHSTGEYITFVDSDDFIDKDYIEYLYNLIVKYNTNMSICQHRVVFEKKIEEHGSAGEEVLTNKECLEKMLYHNVIDTTACSKLYKRSLFDKIEFPYGKLFEDIGTTYLFMLQCDYIAIGYASKYNYLIRQNSIVNCSFSLKKLDMIEMTDKMARDVLRIYPDLEKAVLRRRIYARFSTLNQMRNTSDYEKERKRIITFILKNKKTIFLDEKVPRRDKVAVILLSCGYFAYKNCWNIYCKVTK